MEWMIMPLKRYADFNGRSRRTEFWMFQLLNVLVYGAVIVLMLSGVPWSALNQAESGLPADPGAMFWVGMVVLVFWALMCLPGTPGDNNFGGDPKDPDNLDVFA